MTPEIENLCPCCFGTGLERAYNPAGKGWGCLGCNGSGHRSDFTARMLSGTIELDEYNRPFEPYRQSAAREFYGSWRFEIGPPPKP